MARQNVEEGSWAADMSALLESGRGADVTLAVGDSELPAHSFILAARSPVFAATLAHDTQEARSGRIVVADVQEVVVREMLRFMYTDMAPQLDSVAAELLAASDKYDLPLLKKWCELAVARGLTVDNAAATAVLAELHSCPLLEAAAVDFVAAHPQVMATEGWKNTLLHNAEFAVKICGLLAEALPKSRFVSEGDNGKLADCLIEAVKNNRVQKIQELLAAGVPVDAKDGGGYTALHRAVMQNCLVMVKCLVAAGADVNAKNFALQTPLHYAARRTDLQIVWHLLGASASVDAKDENGQTPLHWAVASGNDKTVRALLAAGARKTAVDCSGNSPERLAGSSMKDIFRAF